MLQKYISVFAILTVCMAQSQELLFNPLQSISPGFVLDENNVISTDLQSAPVKSGTSIYLKPAPIRSGILTFSPSVPINNGNSIDTQSAPLDSDTSIDLLSEPISSGISFATQSAPINSVTTIDLKPAPISSGVLTFSPSVPISNGNSIDTQSAPISSGTSIDLLSEPISSGISFDFQSAPINNVTTIVLQPEPINPSIGLQWAPKNSSTSIDSETPPINNNSQSTVTDPNIELFAHSIFQLLQSSNAFDDHGTFLVYEPYSIIFDCGYAILKRGGIIDPTLADLIAQAAEDVALLSSDLFYKTVSYMLAKILDLKWILTQEAVENVPQRVMSFVEDYANENEVYDTESVISAVGNGIYNIADSVGLATVENLTLAFKLFAEYIKELASGAQV